MARPATNGIRLNGVRLMYPSSPLRTFSIKEWAFNLLKLKLPRSLIHDVCALDDINLEIREGERVGIIGPNGAGKTSLLKVIAGIYPVQSGTVNVRGQIQAVFDLSLGFEYEATGRENITYRGLLMGGTPSEIAAKEEEIAAFADIGDFIDYPVKTYSAGMAVRLAFSISTALAGDILMLDDVVAAGDASFFAKAKQRLCDMISRARTLLFVTHDLASVRETCERTIWLAKGRVMADGPTDEVVNQYLGAIPTEA